MENVLGTTLYKGSKVAITHNPDQWQDILYKGKEGFSINSKLANDYAKLKNSIDEYCKENLRGYIEKGISTLRWKKITITLPYTDGKTTFDKRVTMSIDDYLDATGYSRTLEYEIGNYEREWGINAIDPKKKIFTLYFNLNLIKFDDGPHIKHVVAHELAHIFFRDHGNGFQDALRQLDPSKLWSESFFDSGISSIGTKKSGILIFIIIGLAGIIWLYTLVQELISSLLNSSTPTF